MAELQFPDIAGRFQQGQVFGRALREEDRQRQNQSRLSELAAQAYGAAPGEQSGLIQQAVAVDPTAGFALGGQLRKEGDERDAVLLRTARLLDAAPEQFKPDLYRQIYPQVSQHLPNLPPEYSPQVGEGVKAFIASRDASTATPTGFREFDLKARAAGLKPGTPEYQQAANIALGREGRAATGGFGFEKVIGADLRERIGRTNPRTGVFEVYDETSGDFTPLGRGASLNPAPPQGPATAGTGAGAVSVNYEGVGIPQAQQQRIAQTAAFMRQAGYPDAEIDAFVNAQISAPQYQAPPTNPALGVGPTPAEKTFSETQGRQAAELGALPERNRLEAEGEGAKVAARTAVETAADRDKTARTKAPQLRNVDRGLDRIEKALTALEGGILGDTGPVDQLYQQYTPAGQELTNAVGSIQNDMLALTRVPGVGSQSDLEQKIANLKYPSLGNDPAVNRRNVEQLRAFMRDLSESLGNAPAQGTGGAGLQVGTVQDGYRYRGGDPASPNSWEQVR